MNELRLWVGREGRFRVECERVVALLAGLGPRALRLRVDETEGYDWAGAPEAAPRAEAPPGTVTVHTSGTTGEPKMVSKRWADVLAGKRGSGGPADRWLLTYSPGRWAGLSVIAHVLRHGATLVLPDSLEVPELARRTRSCTHVSLTPSLFRKLLLTGEDLANPGMRQVTFGGEAAPQRVLDDARRTWPGARISHVYASTELGDLVATSDGREGFPRLPGALDADGELVVGGVKTGDLWRREGDRFLFVGRRSEFISVGGAKVSPSEVEAVLNGLEGVEESRVFGVPSPLLGQLVCAEYRGSAEPAALAAALRARLPKHAVPRLRKVDAIALTGAGKVGRS